MYLNLFLPEAFLDKYKYRLAAGAAGGAYSAP